MNHLQFLRIRARLIAQLLIALVACFCWPLLSWGRDTFHLTGFRSLGGNVLGGAVFAGTLVVLAISTMLVGYMLFPLIRRRRGPLTSPYGLMLAAPTVLFGPNLLLSSLGLIGLNMPDGVGTYCIVAMLTATAAWDFWKAILDHRPQTALVAFLWMLAGEQALVFLNWFQMYFE